MTSADPAIKPSEVELFLLTAFVLGTASASPCAFGGKDFAGMDDGVASVCVLKGVAEV